MNERDIQFTLWEWRWRISPYPTMLCNIYWWYWESDVLYITRDGYPWEYEIKVTHSDFLADAKKSKHGNMNGPEGPARFYYVCPEGLIQPEELPPHAGLIWIPPDVDHYCKKVVVKKESPRRKVKPIESHQWSLIARKSNDRYWEARRALKSRYEKQAKELEEKMNHLKCEGR